MTRIVIGTEPGTGFPLFGWWPKPVLLDDTLLRQHRKVIGVTGSGKSKLLELLWMGAFAQGIAATFIDPHGSSAENLLAWLVSAGFFDKDPRAFEKVLWLEFDDDGEHFFPLNILRLPWASAGRIIQMTIEGYQRADPGVAEGAANFYKITGASLRVLIDAGLSIVPWAQLLTDKAYRADLVTRCTDELTQEFFRLHYDELIDYHQQGQANSALNRAYDLQNKEILRLCFGQEQNRLNVRQILDEGGWVLVNLKKAERLTRRLLGAFITHWYEKAATGRPPDDSLPIHQLILDEFFEFSGTSSDALSDMLTGTRKFGLFLTLAHQNWSDATTKLAGALQNATSRFCFTVGPADADVESQYFANFDPGRVKAVGPSGNPILASAQDQLKEMGQRLRDLPQRHALLRSGNAPPILLRTLDVPPVRVDPAAIEAVRQEYFRRYYTRRDQVKIRFRPDDRKGKRTLE